MDLSYDLYLLMKETLRLSNLHGSHTQTKQKQKYNQCANLTKKTYPNNLNKNMYCNICSYLCYKESGYDRWPASYPT